MNSLIDKAKGMLVGLAVGDAVGTTVEFMARGSFTPVTDMMGGGPFNLEKGQWTDDTSMALCSAASLIEREGFDPQDQMDRFCRWRNEGYMSSNGVCFDIGNTVQYALHQYSMTGNPFSGSTDPGSAGNGSLMRLAPIIIAYYRSGYKLIDYVSQSSKLTHGCDEAIESCNLFARQIQAILLGENKQEVLSEARYEAISKKVNDIGSASYIDKSYDELSGSGYVINTLEAALWCFNETNNFRDAILKVVNLGDDADTTAAVCGQIAGAYYGDEAIPDDWKDALYMREEITDMAEKLLTLDKVNKL